MMMFVRLIRSRSSFKNCKTAVSTEARNQLKHPAKVKSSFPSIAAATLTFDSATLK